MTSLVPTSPAPAGGLIAAVGQGKTSDGKLPEWAVTRPVVITGAQLAIDERITARSLAAIERSVALLDKASTSFQLMTQPSEARRSSADRQIVRGAKEAIDSSKRLLMKPEG